MHVLYNLVRRGSMNESQSIICQSEPRTLKHMFFHYFFAQLILFASPMLINLLLSVFLVLCCGGRLY